MHEITDRARVALLRQRIVVIDVREDDRRVSVEVTGAGEERVRDAVVDELGAEVDVVVIDALPRRLWPARCVGHMEREPGRLQLRYALRDDEHIDDILVAEDADSVAVLGTICASVAGEGGPACGVPFHVHLDSPLGDRVVLDGFDGRPVPYRNVYAEMDGDAA